MNIAITGNIGSGKSTISKILARALNAGLYNSDAICRQQLTPGQPGMRELQRRWGQRFVTPAGTLDRPALRQAAFTQPRLLAELEEILHPLVYNTLSSLIKQGKNDGRWLVAEVPLLFEVGWEALFDYVVVVYIDYEQIFTRVSRRDGRSRENIMQILSTQMPLAEKKMRADYCIDNSSLLTVSVEQVYGLARYLQKTAAIQEMR